MDVGNEGQHADDGHAGVRQAELMGLFDGPHRVVAGAGKRQDLGARRLRGQEIGGEIRRVEGKAHAADHRSAYFADGGRAVAQYGAAEGIIDGDEVPGLGHALAHRADQARGQRVCIVGPMRHERRTGRAGDVRGRGAGNQRRVAAHVGEVGDGQTDRADREIGDGVDMVDVEPLARNGGGHIRLVLMVGCDDDDRLAQDLVVEVGGRELGGGDRAGSAEIPPAAVIAEHADLHHAVGNSRPRRFGVRGRKKRATPPRDSDEPRVP